MFCKMAVADLGEGLREQNETTPSPLAQGLDLPLVGQTRWAESSSQLVSLPGAWPLMKRLAIPLIVIYAVDSVVYVVNSPGQYVLKTYSTSMPTVQDCLGHSLLLTKSPSSCTDHEIHWIQRKMLKVHFSHRLLPIFGFLKIVDTFLWLNWQSFTFNNLFPGLRR